MWGNLIVMCMVDVACEHEQDSCSPSKTFAMRISYLLFTSQALYTVAILILLQEAEKIHTKSAAALSYHIPHAQLHGLFTVTKSKNGKILSRVGVCA